MNARALVSFASILFVGTWLGACADQARTANDSLTGAWQGHVQFTSGAFAEIKDLEFMYAFTADGTMTESSNYDAAVESRLLTR